MAAAGIVGGDSMVEEQRVSPVVGDNIVGGRRSFFESFEGKSMEGT